MLTFWQKHHSSHQDSQRCHSSNLALREKSDAAADKEAAEPSSSSSSSRASSSTAGDMTSINEQIEQRQKNHKITAQELEELGRRRPEAFKNAWSEIGFGAALLLSMFMAEYFISGFNIVLPVLADALSIAPALRTWPASVFSMITGAFLLPIGRLADMFGGYKVFVIGLAWFCIWNIVCGFSTNIGMLIACRALAGLGPACFLPAGIMLMGSIYRPGPRKNLIFSLYGSCSPLGFFAGIFFAGLSGEVLPWSWYFWIGAIAIFVILAIAVVCVPKESEAKTRDDTAKMDWLGSLTIVPGLLLVIFAITESAHASNGWKTPHVWATIVVGGLLLIVAIYVEGWVAKKPLLPFSLFKVQSMPALIVALFLWYGAFGILLFYSAFLIQNVIGIGALLTTAWFSPMAIGGIILAAIGGLIMHKLPGSVLMALSGIGYIVSETLFAAMPATPSYWAWVFPAMICGTLGVDISYTVSNVFITTSLPKSQQGLAGGLINSMLFLGISFWLGVADFVSSVTSEQGVKASYQNALWLGVGCAGLGTFIMVGLVRIRSARSELTMEERKELAVEGDEDV